MLPLLLLVFAAHFDAVFSQCQNLSSLEFAYAPNLSSGVTGQVIFNNLVHPRGMKFDDASNLLVVEAGFGVVALTLKNTSHCQGWERSVVVQNSGYNHGIEIGNGMLYVSARGTVDAYKYDSRSISVGSSNPTTIVNELGGWNGTDYNNTHTLVYQPPSDTDPAFLIVSIGPASEGNLYAGQASSGVSQIRRFALNAPIPTFGHNWMDGEVIAVGVRNGVGLTIDSGNNLWIAENSVDLSLWNDTHIPVSLASPINNNPADELNVVDLDNITGGFYGYPSCATVWDPTGFGNFTTGEQFAFTYTLLNDTSCQSPDINTPPMLTFQAHASPLDIKFYNGVTGNNVSFVGLNLSWVGNGFVSFHGSSSTPSIGDPALVKIPWNTSTHAPVANVTSQTGYTYLIQAGNLTACPGPCIRPVGLQFDMEGRLFVSSDATGEVCVSRFSWKSFG
ncbi:soluble quino protein glucose dehydrogenase [Pluteus cervinus]|uniref:Soluble quino protein glucose dehydrogenase n=1 Tax=Pluteus cervinus TaxID=181527 RepID=A0ACD3A4U3_9AGAR|nr:soluble quino protein glucose dehydrogenase [Pluteus cervinus]